jgi:hypothetical protein
LLKSIELVNDFEGTKISELRKAREISKGEVKPKSKVAGSQ